MPTSPEREILAPPFGEKRVLLHSCCAPCSCELMSAMMDSGIGCTVFFYNPNIHPREEYEIRKAENIRYAVKLGVPIVDADYDPDRWFARVKGLESAPERGARCTVCFDMRFERTALYASEHGFRVFTSSLGMSRWKDMEQVNTAGERAASRHPGLAYWTHHWRKKGGSERMRAVSKREGFYIQEYCGCVYSLRDADEWRLRRGREKIQIGPSHPCSTERCAEPPAAKLAVFSP